MLGLICLLAACGGKSGGSTNGGTQTDAAGCVTVSAPATHARTGSKPALPLDATKTYEVVVKTNCGSFTIRLDPKQSPHAVASFVKLVEAKFFDDTVFHRIVPGFVIQGGDPTASGTGGPGYTTVDTPPASASYTHGVVAMAKTGAEPAGTAGSQFFVVTGDDIGLPPDYAIIGKVTDGLDVVDRIGKLGDASEQPTEIVEIEQATVSSS
jgi:cyclophilin family peptidyl-prolyl cis-trans isomerase